MREATLNQKVLDRVNDVLAYNKITYTDIAERLGTSRSAISRALSGKYSISLTNLERICKAAGIKVEFSITGDVEKGLLSEDAIRAKIAKGK